MSKVSTLFHTYEPDTLMENSLLERALFISTFLKCRNATLPVDLALLLMPEQAELRLPLCT